MEEKTVTQLTVPYDSDGIIEFSKKRLTRTVLQLCICGILLIASVIAVLLFGENLPVFIISVSVVCLSLLFGSKSLKTLRISDYKSAVGEISEVYKDVRTVRTTKAGGIGPLRKYDKYTKNEIRLGVFIKKADGEISSFHFNDGTEKHAEYYEEKGCAIHIWGTRFPVKLDLGKDEWLCPLCGEFNLKEEKDCVRCRNKILK